MNETGATDSLLAEVAQCLTTKGRHLSGVVQTNGQRPHRHLCDMDVQVLPDGPVIRISQDLGPEAKGCRLDASALDDAIALVENQLGDDTELLILNKFGKYEAEGRGFRTLIAEALSRDIPVLTGINALNRSAFETFAGDMFEYVPATKTDILAALQTLSE